MNRFVVLVGWLIVAGGLLFCRSARAASGAAVPWTTYEGESMSINGGFILGPSYNANLVQSESSGRRCARLNSSGAYAEFTAQGAASALVVRYSVPDSAGGGGTDYTLSLYKNGTLIAKLPMTSKYSWLYGGYPFVNTPGSAPRNFFDEVRTNNLSINLGDIIRLQKDATDSASYYDIDLVDLETVPAALTQPGGAVSIKSAPYNAVGDGINDDTAALQNCINANGSVWLPPGSYKITGSINLPSNRTVKGAGMWYSTLVGDPSLYGNSGNRVTLNGNGSNIQLSDFAIVGKLTYRNDSEPNDGIGGSFGTGSAISRVWVEHTKTGAWVVNSLGLVVDGCRFRNTIADGINCVVGMRSTTVTNCTARGTGDDCFAIWPAKYITPTYAPGLNVITHCTAQTPFLANGGAIYGGDSNRIEDCLFQDMPYGCGILFSTTFTVSANFSGTTIAQRCDLNRCGGYDPGLAWRAAVQFFLQNTGITGVNLNNLNITNSASDGMSIGYGPGVLSNAIISNVSIPNYGLGVSGRHGLWARSDAVGSMTVSNSTIVEYSDDSPTFSFNFVTSTIPVTVQSSPSGRSFTVDGTSYTNTQVFNWIAGSSHTIATTATQGGGTGVQYVWSSWSDGGAMSHTIAPASSTTYTANFTTQYFLTISAGAGGNVSPSSGWTNSGVTVNISATASNGYSFSGWTGTGSGSYSGANNPTSITANGPITETATFVSNILVTVQPNPTGRSFTVDSVGYSTAQVFSWVPGSSHAIATTSPQSGGAGTQYLWNSWSDGGAMSHTIAPASNATYTANFTTQYYLTMNGSSGGAVSPASGWNDSGAGVNISATASNGYSFGGWTGSGAGSYSGGNGSASITMNGPITQSGSFFVPDVASLVFAQQPSDVLQSATITPQVQVQALGTNGQPLASVAITISLGSGTGTLSGTLTRSTDGGGVAHFNDLNVDQPGSKTLSAGANAVTTNSVSFMVIGPAVALAFTTQPGSAVVGVPFDQQPVLKTVDALGNPSTTGLPASLSIYVQLTNSTGHLLGTTNYNIGTDGSNGVIAFQDLAIDAAGTSNQLVASASTNGGFSLNNAVSVAFNVSGGTNGPPAQGILGITPDNGGNVTLTYDTTPGFSYHIEMATNLVPTVWMTVAGSATNATGSSATFTVPSQGGGPFFYRTVSP